METPLTSVTPLPPQSRETAVERPQLFDESAQGFAPPSGGLLEYWRIIQRRRGTVIVISCLGLLAGFLYTLPQTPIYQARAVIEIQSLNSDFLYGKDLTPTANTDYDPGISIQTEVRVLQSRALLDRVVRKLGLEKKDLVTRPSRLDAWRKALKLAPAAPPSREAVIANAAAGLRIKTQENTRLIEIYSDSTSPQMAADFVNTLTDEFVAQNRESRWKAIEDTGKWLERQMDDMRIKLEKAEGELQSYASQHGLLFTEEKNNLADQKVKQLQEALSTAQADLINRQSQFEHTAKAPGSVPEIQDDPSLKSLQDKLVDLRTQKAMLLLTYTPEHSKVQKVQEQIAALEPVLKEQQAAVITRMRNDYEAARQREQLLSENFAAAARNVAEQADNVTYYSILKRDVDTTRQIYDTMLQRVKEAGVASAIQASNVRRVDDAVAPSAPYKPSPSRNAMIGLLSGLFGGILLVVFLDRADRSIQEPGDATFFLGIPELGVVPNAAIEPGAERHLLSFAAGQTQPEAFALVARERAHSAMAESIRTVLTSIMFANPDTERPRVIVITSAAPGEGKSTLVANLAATLADINQRVLLIDADLRRPGLHRFFGLENADGIAELLRGANPTAPANVLIRRTEIPNLSLLMSGPPKTGNPTLLYSDRLRDLLASVRNEYDAVFIDTPPMLTMADARVIARYSDAVILVARANRTSRQALRDACQRFLDDGANVLGAVLNDWNPKKSTRYGYAHYYQRYKHYYAQAEEKKN